jgi:hypothetical protein
MGSIGRWIIKWRMKDPVKGTAFVVSANRWTRTQVPSPLRAKLVVEGDGVPKTTVEHSERVGPKLWDVWPSPGQTLPVTIDKANPTRLVIEWQQLLHEEEQRKQRKRAAGAEKEERLLDRAYGRKS